MHELYMLLPIVSLQPVITNVNVIIYDTSACWYYIWELKWVNAEFCKIQNKVINNITGVATQLDFSKF